jgi:parvulin-like peptidyl-prolyl isomerase
MIRLRQIVLGFASLSLLSAAAQAADMLDRVLVTVNSSIILQSDLEMELRLQKLMAGTPNAPTTQADREAALDRLINRVLLQEEMQGIDLLSPTDPQITAQIAEVRKQIKDAETEEGWRKLLAQTGLTADDIRERIAEEVNTNLFIGAKFRPSLRVNAARIQSYYKEVLVPELKKKGDQVPALEQVSPQIERILAEQTLNELFSEWIKGLRSQARMRAVDPTVKLHGFEAPSSLAGMNFLPLRISNEQGAPKSSATAPATGSAPTPQQR